MRSIRGLFKETRNDIDRNHLDRLGRRYRYFDSTCLNNIPKIKNLLLPRVLCYFDDIFILDGELGGLESATPIQDLISGNWIRM